MNKGEASRLANPFSEAALAWLNELLRSRISSELELIHADDGSTRVRVAGSILSLDFTDCDPGLRGHTPVTNCAHWESEEAGLRAPSGLPMPVPTSRPVAPDIKVLRGPEGCRISCDIPGLIYWHLTRLEELSATVRDGHGRFPAVASHAHAHGYLERPIVDEWIDLVAQMVTELWPGISMVARGAAGIQPSHDVDFPCRYAHCSTEHFIRHLAKDCLQRKRPLDAVKGLLIRATAWKAKQLPSGDPYNTFDWIMSQSERHGLRSQFYVVCGGRHRLDPGYDPGHPAIRKLMRDIHLRGHLLGLHPSYGCMDDPAMLAEELSVLRRLAAEEGIVQEGWGVRMHYVRCLYPDLWRQLDSLGADHDASMGYADRVGFRAGTAFSYPAFDPALQRAYALKVRPFVVMEGTLYAKSYMHLGNEERLRKLDQLSRACAQVGADFSLLWHNSELADSELRSTYVHGLRSQATAH